MFFSIREPVLYTDSLSYSRMDSRYINAPSLSIDCKFHTDSHNLGRRILFERIHKFQSSTLFHASFLWQEEKPTWLFFQPTQFLIWFLTFCLPLAFMGGYVGFRRGCAATLFELSRQKWVTFWREIRSLSLNPANCILSRPHTPSYAQGPPVSFHTVTQWNGEHKVP
jgi:hypothetical protein